MRLIYMGSPEPVIPPLAMLLEEGRAAGHEVVAVISQPPRPVGRGGQVADPPLAAFAKSKDLLTLQPEKASDPAFLETLRALCPDVIITAAYGQILSRAFLAIPRRATINIHPSLLPLYRGATPVPAALRDGATTTGVTVLFTVPKLDAGHAIIQETTQIDPDETADELTLRLFRSSSPLLLAALCRLTDPAFTGTPQDEAAVTYCGKIDKNDGCVLWDNATQTIYNRFRAFTPWPGSFTYLGDKRLVLTRVRPGPMGVEAPGAPGTVSFDNATKALKVATRDGYLLIYDLKPAGKGVIPAQALWNGLRQREDIYFHGSPTP